MPNPRPSAWMLISVLVASMLLIPASAVPVLAAPNPAACSPGQGPTLWKSDVVPPTSIRVLRADGPNKGHVETVPFWDYVGVVVRTEYSGSGPTGATWFRVGAQSVKQYAWFYTMRWRGGKVSFTVTNEDGTTTTTVECYDVKDSTADQLYRPVRWDATLQAWVPRNVPTAQHLQGMADVWHISLRKWKPTANKTFMYLTGYRSGTKVPCGTDKTGFRIYQKGLRDCVQKGLTFEEALRRYYEPVYIVDSRRNDSVADANTYYGDLGLLTNSAGKVRAQLLPGAPDRFGTPVTQLFSGLDWSTLDDEGVGDVNGDNRADLVMLTNAGTKLQLALSNGNKLDNPTTTNLVGAAVERLFVADYNGDRRVDAGLLRSTGAGTSSLAVMLSQAGGSFAPEAPWWTGPLDLSGNVFVAAGDVNGDGKADLVTRDATGAYSTALSRASCSSFATWGLCLAAAIGVPGLDAAMPAFTSAWALADAKSMLADFDRDGRKDVLVLLKDGSGSRVVVLRSTGDGTFANAQQLWQGSVDFADVTPVAMDINPDGLADIALVSDSGDVTWLRGIERTAVPASMTHMSSPRSLGDFASARPF